MAVDPQHWYSNEAGRSNRDIYDHFKIEKHRDSFPGLGGLEETKMFLPHSLLKLSIVGSLHDREVACPASDLQGLNFKSCVWKAVSSHHPQEVLLAQFSPYVHKSGLMPDSSHLIIQKYFSALRVEPEFSRCWAPSIACIGMFHSGMHIPGFYRSPWQFLDTRVKLALPVYVYATSADAAPTKRQRIVHLQSEPVYTEWRRKKHINNEKNLIIRLHTILCLSMCYFGVVITLYTNT